MASRQTSGKRILFWSDSAEPWTTMLTSWFGVPQVQPWDFVRKDIPYDDRRVVARALDLRSTMNPTGGEILMGYFGIANCRICKAPLGSRDLFGHGFVWPEKADHYVLNHNVWTPDCDELLMAVRRRTP